MAQIQPVTVWYEGEERLANQFSLTSINDNLSNTAKFVYQLLSSTNLQLASGNLTMSGQDYQDWGSQSSVDINEWAYDWAAQQLNLTITAYTTTTTTSTTTTI